MYLIEISTIYECKNSIYFNVFSTYLNVFECILNIFPFPLVPSNFCTIYRSITYQFLFSSNCHEDHGVGSWTNGFFIHANPKKN